jgi:hypothetical protein
MRRAFHDRKDQVIEKEGGCWKHPDSMIDGVAYLRITCSRPIHSNVILNSPLYDYDARRARVLITSRNEVGSRH